MNEETVLRLWAKSYPDDPDRFHPLWCHLLDVGAVCEALLPRFGGIPGLPDGWLPYLAALHDIGKADARFQGKAPGLVAPEILTESEGGCRGFRHEARSADWITPYLKGQWEWGQSAARIVSLATRGHHGDFLAGNKIGANYNEAEYPDWVNFYTPMRDQLAALVAERLGVQPAAPTRFDDASAAGIKLSGLIVLADWIASNPETYRYPNLHPAGGIEPSAYLTAAREEARRAVHRLELDAGRSAPPTGRYGFTDVWPDLKEFPLRPSQQALQEVVQGVGVLPGLAIIEAPMGEGKTEAAIYLAACWGKPGAYIALPTQATGNQMHRRYARFLSARDPSGPPPRLVHGMAWLQDSIAPEEVSQTWGEDIGERLQSREWFANAKRALLAQDGVGTVDQVLMAALNVKHGFLRLLGLTTKTLIIDEVHAYDVYMTTLMKTLLRWCRALDVPVILLSATLSRAQKQALAEAYAGADVLPQIAARPESEPYPLLTFVPREGSAFVREIPLDAARSRTVRLERHPGLLADPEETACLAKQAVAAGGCACVLANTVASAQKIFMALQADPPQDTELLLFHARFRAERRQEIEDQVVGLFGKGPNGGKNLNRPTRAILVATQVVEQSLDIDFDVMLSHIAPVDLLLQRSGRLHRHSDNDPRPTGPEAVFHVLLPPPGEPDFGGMEVKKSGSGWRGVYDRAALLRTLALLETRDAFHLPADFRPLIEGCYSTDPLPDSVISPEWIQQAETLRDERRAASQRNAEKHLVPDPNPRVFQYARDDPPNEEGEEGERTSFFRAQTREGDDSRAVLILHDPALVAAVRAGIAQESQLGKDWHPGRTRLKALFLQKAALPAYWLSHVTAMDGYEMLTEVPKRLRHHVILVLQAGRWEGTQMRRNEKTGKETITHVTITDDPLLGLSWSSVSSEKETEDAD